MKISFCSDSEIKMILINILDFGYPDDSTVCELRDYIDGMLLERYKQGKTAGKLDSAESIIDFAQVMLRDI